MSWTLYIHHTVRCKTDALCVEPFHTVLSVKRAIHELTGLQIRLQKLLFNGRHLDDDQATLLSYQVENWSKIVLVPQAVNSSEITVKTLSGRSISVQAEVTDTVEDICAKIEQKEPGISSEQQQLIYGGMVLEWDAPLERYKIQQGSVLHMVSAPAHRRVFLKMPAAAGAGAEADVVPLTVSLSGTVENLSRKIAEKLKIPPDRQALSFKGVSLEKGKPLTHYSIRSDSVINVATREEEVLQDLFIRTPIGKMVKVGFLPSDTVKLIKQKVHAKVGLEPERQVLLLAGTPLENSVTLGSFDISAESNFHLVLRSSEMNPSESSAPESSPPEINDLVQIFIRTLTGKTFTLEVSVSDSIRDVKAKIQQLQGLPIDQQVLLTRGEPLSDALRLRDYNIETESTFYLTLTSGPKAEHSHPKSSPQNKTEGYSAQVIYIRNFLGKSIALEIGPSDKIKTLKAKIFAKEGIPVDQQQLLFQGDNLDDEKFIKDYNIEQESNLQLAFVSQEKRPSTVLIKTPNGSVTVEIPHSSKVRDLKRKLQSSQGTPPEQQVLFAGSQELSDDDAKLSSYDVSRHNFLQLSVRRSAQEKVIFVSYLQRTVSLAVSLGERVGDVKAKISNREGVHSSRQTLLFQGRELEDSRALSEYRIDYRSTVELVLKDSAKIAVKMPSGETFPVDVRPGSTIASVKHAIQLFKDVPARRQDLMNEKGVVLRDEADTTAVGNHLTMVLRPVTLSVVASRYDRRAKPRVITVRGMKTVNDLEQQVQAALNNVPCNRLKLFHNGKILTNELSHLVEDDSVVMLDVTVPTGETLSGVFDGQHRLFEWKDRGIKLQLPSNTSITAFTIHEIALSTDEFRFPPSVRHCSQVYELSCTYSEHTNIRTLCTSADIAVPYRQEPGSRPSFFLAKRIPQWQCDLSPVYTFWDTKRGRFESLATYSVREFDCYLCVCF